MNETPCTTYGQQREIQRRAKMKPFDYESLSPGIREVVRTLRCAGIDTTDSGDGSNHTAGMECAVPFPMVAAWTSPTRLQLDLETARVAITSAGVVLTPEGAEGPTLTGSIDAADGTAVILLTHCTDDMLQGGTEIGEGGEDEL